MKKFLPIFFAFIFAAIVFIFPNRVNAQAGVPNQQLNQGDQVPAGSWVIDPEVTFIGKNAARSGNLLDFILQNYNWVCVKQVPNSTQCDNSDNPLRSVWLTTVTFIIAPLLLIVILAASVIIIVTRGRSLTIMRFFPRFIGVLLLIFLTFPLLQFIYQFIDSIQGFFLRREIILVGTPFGGNPCPPDCISQKDLLYVGWDYRTFIGLRLLGDQNSESAFISLLLTKLTAFTYYVMVGILIIRRIILWLFIIVSPIFPILLLFYPIRNTGKIWVGEFFRWLLYAPLFSIFLNGLVALWRNQIPLVFSNPDIGNASKIIYPTAVNILLGGPKQFVTPTNSINLTETFALYVVSLLMLWGVIILPWILLQIFLDYASNLGVGDSVVMKKLVNKISNIQNPPGGPAIHPPAGGGTALNLPFAKKFNLPVPPSAPTGMAREIPTTVSEAKRTQTTYMPSAQVKAETLSVVNMSLPSMRDIAKYDTSLISKDKDKQKETIIIRENLEKIGNPAVSSSTTERERYVEIREKLVQQSNAGNTMATSILNAASTATKRSVAASTTQIKNVLTQIANPTTVAKTSAQAGTVINREKLSKINESLVKAKREGNTLASSILSVNDRTSNTEIERLQERIRDAKVKGEPIATQIADLTQIQKTTLPTVNRVQTVSKEDYEAVKDMWKENYKNLEVPQGMTGSRSEWIKDDISKIDEIVNLLSSSDQEQIAKGMDEVSSILPFLLVGGFSTAEIVSYLKAKQDAAKEVTTELAQEEDDKVSIGVKKTTTAAQTMTATMQDESETDESELSNLVSTKSGSVVSKATDEILSLVNIKLPKISDIARYESSLLSKDKSQTSEVEKMHEELRKIGNPDSVVNVTERERYQKIKEKLVDESQSGNIIARAVLSAASGTKAGGLTGVPAETKAVLAQIANPTLSASESDKKRFTDLNEQLTNASRQGDSLASSLLSVKETATKEDIEKLTSQLNDEKTKGNILATSVLSNMSSPVSLPSTNRIQTVSQEDYKAVKDMWNKNYQSLDVPQGMAETREEWIKGDIEKIENIVSMLSSKDQTEQNKGMEEVSSILPFLLVGGFSQSEIVSYLQAKQQAAKETLTLITKEEEDKVSVSVKKTNIAQQSMSTAVPVDSGANESVVQDVSAVSKNITIPQVSAEILSLANLSLPTITDVARYETASISKDQSKITEIEKTHEVFKNIASPESITISSEKERFTKLREKLIDESQKGNVTAQSILLTAQSIADPKGTVRAQTNEGTILSQIANPASVVQPAEKKRLTQLHDLLVNADKEGSGIAHQILSLKGTASASDVANLGVRLREAKDKGDSIATAVLSAIAAPVSFPSTNRVQTVSQEDYKAVKDMWKENYQNLDLPLGISETRTEWIKGDISKIDNIISQLSSNDPEQQAGGMDEISSILPFLLIGGFSQSEIVSYLQAKQQAAKETLVEIFQGEDTQVTVENKSTKVQQGQAVRFVAREEVLPSDSSSIAQSTTTKSFVAPQISEEILKLANLQLPSLSDIVSYEVKDLTKDKTQSERIEQIREVLERISNPTNIVSASEREKYESLSERLNSESQKGNITADVILSAVSQLTKTAGQIDATLSDVKTVLLQIVNASNISDVDDRGYYTRLHEYLEKESKEKNNTLAQKILSVNESTKIHEIAEIRDQMSSVGKEGAPALTQVASAVNDFSKIKQLRSVIGQVLAPEQVVLPKDRENFVKLHESLNKEGAKGNSLATSLMSVSEKTSDSALKELHERLITAGKSGDPVASSILAQTSIPSSFANTTRLHEVTPEEHEEVRGLWQKAYKQYLVPQGFTENTTGRSDWINKDISDIEQTINLLNSNDPDKKNEGLEKVSSILPFLLLGGYSFDDINNYLRIKLEAAKYALTDIQQEEDSKVPVGIKKTISTEQQMTATVSESGQSDNLDQANVTIDSKNIINPQVTNEILNLVNINLPTIADIAKYETASLSKDKSKSEEVSAINQALSNIGNPESAASSTDRERYTKLRVRLVKESKKGSVIAQAILSAASGTKTAGVVASPTDVRAVLSQIANPLLTTKTTDKERFATLHDQLTKASTQGNTLAASLLSVKETATKEDIEKLTNQLNEEKAKGNDLATSVLSNIATPVSLPAINRIQAVSTEDYKVVKDLWKQNYQNLEVPSALSGNRADWIRDDISKIDNIVSLLSSSDQEKVSQGMNEVSSILPFLLVGGFSQSEIISYLQAKQEAAKETLTAITKDEEEKVSVKVGKTNVAQQSMAADVSLDSGTNESAVQGVSGGSKNITIPQVSKEILSLANLSLPRITDVAKYEVASVSKDKSKITEMQIIREVFKNIANPQAATVSSDKEHYIQLREKLIEESKKGDVTAQSILSLAQSVEDSKGIIQTQVNQKTILSQIANPASVTQLAEKKRFTDLHDLLVNAGKEGSGIANEILSFKATASAADVASLSTRLQEAKEKGDSVASAVLSNIASPVSFPSTNRVQTVSSEDYKAVKDMWKQNYQSLEVPSELSSNRADWIKEDISKIDNIVSLLSSSDQEKVSQGMNEVSSILPFLLVGGFSQSEIVSYLQAKQEAAREVSTSLIQDEEGKVPVSAKKIVTAAQTMTASTRDSDPGNLSVKQSSGAAQSAANELLKSININIPTIADIARYEAASLSKDKEKSSESTRIQESLGKITNPAVITVPAEREKFQKLQDRLILESQNQNAIAASILNASSSVSQKTLNVSGDQIKNVFLKVVNPASADTEGERKRLGELRNMLDKDARENNNKLAATLLSVNEKTTIPEMEKIRDDLKKGQIEGNRLANNIIWTINRSILGVQTTEKAKKVFTQIANPTLVVNPAERTKFAKAHDVLLKASLSGNHLANSILSVSEKSTIIEVDRIVGELKTGKSNNDPVALDVSALMGSSISIELPSVNKVQTVGQKDYESVKQIWKESYKNLDIPQGTEANRVEWIKKDIADIDNITNQLSSQDGKQVEKGMDEVSNILPFILVGGFSQGEIVSYLKAKQDAAKETLEVLSKDEEEKVGVLPKKAEESKEMSVKEEIDHNTNTSINSEQEKKNK